MGGVRADCHRLIRLLAAVRATITRTNSGSSRRWLRVIPSLGTIYSSQIKSRLRGGASTALKGAFKDAADGPRVPLPRRDASRHATV